MFKPCLAPNSDLSVDEIIDLVDNIRDYACSIKFDGVRVEVTPDGIVSRSLKPFRSIPFNQRFGFLVDIAKKHNVIIEAEFHANYMTFNEINRFCTNTDVRTEKERKELEAMKFKYPTGKVKRDGKPEYKKIDNLDIIEGYKQKGIKSQFDEEYKGRSVEWLTTFHEDLKLRIFDVHHIDKPDMIFMDRVEVIKRLVDEEIDSDYVEKVVQETFESKFAILELFDYVVHNGGEGIMLKRWDSVYKYGRYTMKSAQAFKLKDNSQFYEGVIIDIEEGTSIKDGIERTTNELGRSVTSKYKEDREPSGMAKCFTADYNGKQIKVGLKGFNNSEKEILLLNKADYIGRKFIYKGMPPVKDVPRHAYFKEWL